MLEHELQFMVEKINNFPEYVSILKKITDNGSKQKPKDDHLDQTVFLKKYRGTDSNNYRAQQDANNRPDDQGDRDNKQLHKWFNEFKKEMNDHDT